MQRSERRSFDDFCSALQAYPRPLAELGSHQRFAHKRNHNQWSVTPISRTPLVGGAVMHRFQIHFGDIPMEPIITLVAHPEQGFNAQVASAARGAFGRAFGPHQRRWSPKLW